MMIVSSRLPFLTLSLSNSNNEFIPESDESSEDFSVEEIVHTPKMVKELIQVLTSSFEMQHTGKLSWILSMEVKETSTSFSIQQGLYIRKILEKFQMQDCKAVPTPYVEKIAKIGNEKIEIN